MYAKRHLILQIAAFLVFVFAFDVACAWAQAEGLVRGRVQAAADGSAVVQASVTLRPVSAGSQPDLDNGLLEATTDAAGEFLFPRVRPGEYLLAATSEGFGAREVRVMIAPREVTSLTLALEVGRLDVSVNVTGEMPLTGTHSPSSTVLTVERLDQIPLTQRTSVPDALVTLAPGMIRGHDDFVHIRGHEVALNPLINGVSFWENPHALFSGGLSLDVIDTANVMTGGFSAEYGNRFGGVVDIVTKSGFTMREAGSMGVNAGEAGRRSISGEFGGHEGRFGYYAFGTLFGSDRFLSPPDPQAIHDTGRGGHAFAQLDGSLDRLGALRAVFMGDGANFEIPKTLLDVTIRPDANAEQRTRQQTATIGWTRAWPETLVSASVYQRGSRVRLLPAGGQLTAQASVDRRLATVGAKVDATRSAGRHTFKTGIDFVRLRPRENLTYDYTGYRDFTHLLGLPHIHVVGQNISFAGRESGGQASVYAQDRFQLASRLTADFGVRVDRYDLVASSTQVSPRLNVALQASAGTVLHASYNRFVVPPPVEGILSSSAALTQSIREIGRALPVLAPTIEHQFELGMSAQVRPVQAALTGYFRSTDNPVHTTVWPDSRIYSYASFDRARAFGLEARGDVRGLTRYGIMGYVNYALGRVYFYNPVTGGFVTEAAHLNETNRFLGPMDQTHTLTSGATYTHAGTGIWIGTTVEYGSGTPIGHGAAEHAHADGDTAHAHASSSGSAARVPGHVMGSLSLGANLLRRANRRSRLTLQVDVENVTNNVYLIAKEGEFSPTQFSIPRLVSVSAKVRF
jgi:TonB dependent receptor/Carboxypeptidase regulatory-like domain